MATNTFRVKDLMNFSGREEVVAALEVVDGDVDNTPGFLVADDIPASRWRISQVIKAYPGIRYSDNGYPLVTVAMDGPKTLSVGMLLHD